jgi:hypothetical protein
MPSCARSITATSRPCGSLPGMQLGGPAPLRGRRRAGSRVLAYHLGFTTSGMPLGAKLGGTAARGRRRSGWGRAPFTGERMRNGLRRSTDSPNPCAIVGMPGLSRHQ